MLTPVSISTFLSFNLSIFTEEDGTTINNEDKKEFLIRKNAKIYWILKLAAQAFEVGHFLNIFL